MQTGWEAMGQGGDGWVRHVELAAAWALCALVFTLAVVSSVIDLRAGASPLGAFLGDTTMPIVGFALVGALIIAQRPRHRLGWMLLAAPVFLAGSDVATRLAAAAQDQPAAVYAAWTSRWLWSPGFVLLFVLIPICFPDGRLPSARWRPVLIVWVVATAAQVLGFAVDPAPLKAGEVVVGGNPFALDLPTPLLAALQTGAGALLVPSILVAVPLALRQRARAADPTGRAQVKWFLAGMAGPVCALLASTTPAGQRVLDVVGGIALLAVPAAIGVAILRHRLYDIDRLISRTLAWALLSAALGGLYLGAVVGLGALLRPFGGSSDLAVAGSTLAVAAVFRPARRRVQHLVDRRFNRARYDAERTVDAYRVRLREETHLDEVTAGLVSAVHGTVQPAAASVWLRTDAGLVHQ